MDPSARDTIFENILTELDENALYVLENIHKHGPVTITGLMEITQTPRTTLNRSIKVLKG